MYTRLYNAISMSRHSSAETKSQHTSIYIPTLMNLLLLQGRFDFYIHLQFLITCMQAIKKCDCKRKIFFYTSSLEYAYCKWWKNWRRSGNEITIVGENNLGKVVRKRFAQLACWNMSEKSWWHSCGHQTEREWDKSLLAAQDHRPGKHGFASLYCTMSHENDISAYKILIRPLCCYFIQLLPSYFKIPGSVFLEKL